MKTAISIATYNEKDNIEKLIRQIFGLAINNLSVIVVDDNSPDGTADIVSDLKTQFPDLYLIRRPGKLGYGSAHIAGFKKGLDWGADIIVSMDADFSHQPEKIIELVRAIESGADVAVGSRKIKGGEIIGWNLWRKFASGGAMLLSKAILGIKTNDLTSGFRAYHRLVFDKISLDAIGSNGYSFLEELIYLVERAGLMVVEVPITFVDRQHGRSKLSKREIIKFFITIFKIKFKFK